jgi:hypothetical protein
MSLHPLTSVFPPDIHTIPANLMYGDLDILKSKFLDPAGFYIYNFIPYFPDVLLSQYFFFSPYFL